MADTRSLMLEWSMDPGHGGFLGYFSAAGTVPDAAADLARVGPEQQRLAAVAGFTEHEQRLLRWFGARRRVSATAGGYLTSGKSTANHDASPSARDRHAGWDVRRDGVAAGPKLTAYAPATVHDTVQRAADLIGIGYRRGAHDPPSTPATVSTQTATSGEVTLADVERYGVDWLLDELATDLRDGTYRPQAARRAVRIGARVPREGPIRSSVPPA